MAGHTGCLSSSDSTRSLRPKESRDAQGSPLHSIMPNRGSRAHKTVSRSRRAGVGIGRLEPGFKLTNVPPGGSRATRKLLGFGRHGPVVLIWETKRVYRREGGPPHCRSINRTSFGLELATSPNKKRSRTEPAVRERCDSPTSN